MTNNRTRPDHTAGAFSAHRSPAAKRAQIDYSDRPLRASARDGRKARAVS